MIRTIKLSLCAALLMAMASKPQNSIEAAPKAKPPELCTTSDRGVNFIKRWEGYSPFVYLDAVGKPTIGHGHLITPTSKFEEPLSPQAAHDLLVEDVRKHEKPIHRLVKVRLQTHKCDALSSFVFNLGGGALQKSTLLKKVNAGEHDLVPDEFRKWNRAGGVVLRGLVNRREQEAQMYSGN
jgi:lysozyme